MNVIETLRDKITTCPLMKDFNAVHIDYTEPNDGQAGLFFNGATLVRQSIGGDADWQARFTLYTFCDTFEVTKVVNIKFKYQLITQFTSKGG